MRIGRIASALAAIAFAFLVPFQFSAVSSSAHSVGSMTSVAVGVPGPDAGLPYN